MHTSGPAGATMEALLAPVAAALLKSGNAVHATDLPALPERIASHSIIITKSSMAYADVGRDYGLADGVAYYRADVLNFLATRTAYRVLAAALSCIVLRRGAESVAVELTHPMSEIKVLGLHAAHDDLSRLGLVASRAAVEWRLDRDTAVGELAALSNRLKPRFLLSHQDDETEILQPWDARDHVALVASEVGLLLLTSAVVDYARNGVAVRELACRAPPCAGSSLGAASAEARFWLPGSIHHSMDPATL